MEVGARSEYFMAMNIEVNGYLLLREMLGCSDFRNNGYMCKTLYDFLRPRVLDQFVETVLEDYMPIGYSQTHLTVLRKFANKNITIRDFLNIFCSEEQLVHTFHFKQSSLEYIFFLQDKIRKDLQIDLPSEKAKYLLPVVTNYKVYSQSPSLMFDYYHSSKNKKAKKMGVPKNQGHAIRIVCDQGDSIGEILRLFDSLEDVMSLKNMGPKLAPYAWEVICTFKKNIHRISL